jgi:hypothetical protein
MHNTKELLKQINKTKCLIPYEQLYIQSHHHHKQLIPEQTPCINWFTTNRSSRSLPIHRTYTHNPKPNKPVVPQPATSQKLQVHATHTKNC